MFLAPKIKYCIVIDENGMISQKTTFKGYDQSTVGLNSKEFLDLERVGTILGKSKQIVHEIYMVLRSLREYFNAHNVILIKDANIVRYLLNGLV